MSLTFLPYYETAKHSGFNSSAEVARDFLSLKAVYAFFSRLAGHVGDNCINVRAVPV